MECAVSDTAESRSALIEKAISAVQNHPTKPYSTLTDEFACLDRLAQMGHTPDCPAKDKNGGCVCGTHDAISYAMFLKL